MITRRSFAKLCAVGGGAAASGCFLPGLLAQVNAITPIAPGPEIDQFNKAQDNLLKKYDVSAHSRFLKLEKPPVTAHVLEAGEGAPVLLLHGGNATACLFAPLMRRLQKKFHLFAPDRPGCGLTDKIDYRGVPFREHAVDFVKSTMDGLELPKAAVVGNSMGGYWALLFALAYPDRVTKLVLIGEPAASGPPEPNAPAPPPAPKNPTIESRRALLQTRLGTNMDHISTEVMDADVAGARLPGATLAWDSMREEFQRQKLSTYALRPELKGLRSATLIIWGDNDKLGGGSAVGDEMAAIAPHARCEVVHDAGHLAWLEQPDRCAKLTMDFLKDAG